MMDDTEKMWGTKYYGQLKGFAISNVDFAYCKDTESYFPTFIMKKKGYETIKVEVSRDEEGNGGGFLFISENKKGGSNG
tara:strand:- start:406 stop:642 length:237 start_codon:yes stop_codon:yes gene_type:complete